MSFTEEQAHWQIPMNEVNIVCDVATAKGALKDLRPSVFLICLQAGTPEFAMYCAWAVADQREGEGRIETDGETVGFFRHER